MSSTAADTSLRNLQDGDLQKLAETTGGPCVSILMPSHRTGRETQQDPIRLKNLRSEASEQLQKAGHDDSLLDRLDSLSNDATFWQHQGHGLAIYLTKDDCQMIRLNRSVDEAVHVGDSFLISPLIREHNAQGKYFVLSLTWNEATLYQCDGESLTVVLTELLPAKFDELVLPRDPEEALQNTSHRSFGNTPSSSVGMFHGQGEGEDKIEADRNQFLVIVGDEVLSAIYNTGMPLVVFATTEVSGHFGSTNHVTIDAKVDGSPDSMSEDEIQKAAHEAISPQLAVNHSQLKERFGTAMANSKASQDLNEILDAAKQGKVDSLIICDTHCADTNRAVIETIRQGGDVFLCKENSMPVADAKVAAIYRF